MPELYYLLPLMAAMTAGVLILVFAVEWWRFGIHSAISVLGWSFVWIVAGYAFTALVLWIVLATLGVQWQEIFA